MKLNKKAYYRSTMSLLFVLFLSSAFAQTLPIKGVVLDAGDGTGLPGATILEKGTSNGTVTDIDGGFSLNVNSGATLIFSFIGFQSKEVVVKNADVLSIRLDISAQELSEVVVVGYGTKQRSEISGAVAVVGGDDITKVPALRLEQALQGRTAGVQITQSSGSPGNGLSVRIRGVGSPNNSNPLYIVDGIWVDNVDFLNPNDIESVSILKDAASAAIYGANGANGVVLITTKSGTAQKATVSYNGYYGVQQVAKELDLMNAEQYAQLRLDANGGPFRDTRVESILNDPAALGAGTDWQKEIFNSAAIQSHQVSVLGGAAKSSYALMGGYFKQDGIVGGDKSGFERYNLRLKTDMQANDRLKLGANVSISSVTRNALPENNEFASPVSFALNIDPVTAPYQADGVTPNFSKLVVGDIKNPINRIAVTNDTYKSDRYIGNIFAELEIAKNLKFRSSGSLDINYIKTFSFGPRYNLDTTGIYNHERVDQNGFGKSNQKSLTSLVENTLSYEITFGQSKLGAIVGSTYRNARFEGIGVGLADLEANTPDLAFLNPSELATPDDKINLNAYEFIEENTLISYFGRLDYSFSDKYYLTATVRRDGSSKFGPNNKFGVFPSVSASWNFINEDFINLPAFVTYGKLRGSWGVNGNEKSLGSYGFVAQIDQGLRYVFGADQTITPGSVPTTPSNPDLKWEQSVQTDIGMDLGFWNDKFTFNVDYFIKRTEDLLYPAKNPAVEGSGVEGPNPPFTNVGSFENKGWEFATGFKQFKKNYDYSLNFNITFIETTVVELGADGETFLGPYNQGVGANVTQMTAGDPFGYFYGYKTAGIFQNIFDIEEHINEAGVELQPNAQPGDFRLVDVNGDGAINALDKTIIGDPNPDFVFGLSGTFNVKNFDLSVFFQGSVGNDILNATTRWDLGTQNRTTNRLDRWNGEGTSNTEPRAGYRFVISDYFVEDGSFMRLKNIQLGYSLPNELISKVKLEKLRFYISAQNLITLTKYTGLDPEIGKGNAFDESITSNLNFGIDRGLYPQARIFLVGLNITL